MQTLSSTVREAFRAGVSIHKGAPDAAERFITLTDGRVWRLSESEWRQVLTGVRRVLQVSTTPPRLTDGQARRVAASWHGGQSSPLYALASTGAIVPGVYREILSDLADSERIEIYEAAADSPDEEFGLQILDQAELAGLLVYVDEHGERGPQPGWSDLWD